MVDQPEKIPLWLDCDPGHDDAFAILLALYHSNLNLLGISTVHGNASLSHTTENALRILTALSPPPHSHSTNPTWPVYVFPGASRSICTPPRTASRIHGASGLDGTDLLPEPNRKALPEVNAVKEMRDALMDCPPQTAWLVATGSLTNVALLFMLYPEVMAHIKGLSIMGGCVGDGFTDVVISRDGRRGNWVKWAEFNIYSDPPAAHRVLTIEAASTLKNKVTLCTLDLTHQVRAGKAIRERLLHGDKPTDSEPPSKLRRMFFELLEFFAQKYDSVFGLSADEGAPLHDPLAVAVLLEGLADSVGFEDGSGRKWVGDGTEDRWCVDVLLEGEMGRTVVTKTKGDEGGVRIPRGLDKAKFWDVLADCLSRADEATRDSPVWTGEPERRDLNGEVEE